MSLLLISALALAGPVHSACSWDRPGVNPYMGDVVAAVDRYQDIPPDVRARLKQRMATRRYDELVTIKRDSIAGTYQYTDLRDMHFGQGSVCRTVTRERWPEKMEERGLVYCEDKHCVIVPTVCRNVSRVTRLENKQARNQPPSAPAERLDVPFAASLEQPDMQFDAPSAGNSPSFASLIQDVPTVAVNVVTPASTSHPSAAPRTEPRDTSWWSFAGLPTRTAPPVFVADNGWPRSVLQSPPILSTNLPAVPGIAPPPSTPPVPTVTPPTPPVVVSLPTVPLLSSLSPTGEPLPAPVPGVTPPAPVPTSSIPSGEPAPPVVTTPGGSTGPAEPPEPPIPSVPGVPGVPELPSGPTEPGVPGVQPPSGPSSANPGWPGSVEPNIDSVVPVGVIPEPGTLLLTGLGLALVGWMSRRARRPAHD